MKPFKPLFVFVVLFCSLPNLVSQAQLPYTEDFESGAPGWVLENGTQTNKWYISTATAKNGSKSAYISSTLGVLHNYKTDEYSRTYLYKDITFTTSTGIYEISFDWKCKGNGNAYMDVFLVEPNTLIKAGSYFSSDSAIFLGSFYNESDWKRCSKLVSNSISGKTKRLVFVWQNYSVTYGEQPPAAVDNISIKAITIPGLDNQLISYTKTNSYYDYFYVTASSGKVFMIDWGDGIVDTCRGTNNSIHYSSHDPYQTLKKRDVRIYGADSIISSFTINNGINSLDVSKCKNLKYLNCENNLLTQLDISKNTNLLSLTCSNNQLLSLDISKNTALTYLKCNNNAIPLADMRKISQQIAITNSKLLGVQTLPTIALPLNTAVSMDTVFNGVNSTFTVYTSNGTHAQGTDYVITNEKIRFLTDGVYHVEVRNTGIASNSGYPAVVTLTYVAGIVEKQSIDFRWDVGTSSNQFEIRAHTFRMFAIDWGDGSKDTYMGRGDASVVVSHDYLNKTNSYNVKISANDASCIFTLLDFSDSYRYGRLDSIHVKQAPDLYYLQVSYSSLRSIDVRNNTQLKTLSLSGNPLYSLDISKNTLLESLFCESTSLSSLDVTKNTALYYLRCSYNKISTLDVSKNLILRYLYCHSNQLNLLDISQNTALQDLDCEVNKLTNIDLRSNVNLTNIDCANNPLYTLDVSKNTKLTYLRCYNDSLSELNINKNPLLLDLYCGRNQIKNLDLDHNPKLRTLSCEYNEIDSLDICKNKLQISSLNCSYNRIKKLDVSQDSVLQDLRCSSNLLDSLNVSKNPVLTHLYFERNTIKKIDISKNPALQFMYGTKNQLSALNTNNNPILQYLTCDSNQIATLNISQNPLLSLLICGVNQLKELDVSLNLSLQTLYCHDNRILNLDTRNNTALSDVRCYYNAIPLADLYTMSSRINSTFNKHLGVQTRPVRKAYQGLPSFVAPSILNNINTIFVVRKENGTTAVLGTDYTINDGLITFNNLGLHTVEQTNAAITSYISVKVTDTFQVVPETRQLVTFTWQSNADIKDFKIRATPGKTYTVEWGDGLYNTYTSNDTMPSHTYSYAGNFTVNVAGIDSSCGFSYINLHNRNVNELNVERDTSLLHLDCSQNQLTALNVVNNNNLQKLFCDLNNLMRIDISKNSKLYQLNCSNNLIDSLYTSSNANLQVLKCSYNKLQNLNINNNASLTELYCDHNAIPLSVLYALSLKISDASNKVLHAQLLKTDTVFRIPVNYTKDTIHGGIKTVFVIKQNGTILQNGIDYIFNNGMLQFLREGNYDLEMSNSAIIASSVYETVTVTKPYVVILSNDATLRSLTLSAGRLTPVFSKDSILYRDTVEYEVDEITIIGIPTHDSATAANIFNRKLNIGNNSFAIVVTAENRITTKTYTVIINRKIPIPLLSGAWVSNGSLSPALSDSIKTYTHSLTCENRSCTFTFTTKEGNRMIINGTSYNTAANIYFTIDSTRISDSLKVEVSNGKESSMYCFKINSPLGSHVFYQAHHNMLEMIVNPKNNGGYQFEKNAFQWYANNSIIPEKTTEVLYIPAGLSIGTGYHLTGKLTDGTPVRVCPITAQEFTASHIKAYPNPVFNNKITIENTSANNTDICIYSFSGTPAGTYKSNGEKTEIDISHLPPGSYFISVGDKSFKIIKK